jgi:dephospho-CoA kinase
MSTTIIGLSGKKHSGKNTVAKMIETLAGVSVVEIGFADALKKEVAKACGTSVSFIDEHKDNFRLILQGWGTDYKRKLISDSYWTDKVLQQIQDAINDDIQLVIITDVRFPNEYNFINSLGGILVRISRPIINADNHPSETALDSVNNWHHIILNTGTIDDLEPQVEELIKKIKL